MTVHQLIEQGEYQAALSQLQQTTSGAGADPESLLSRFNLEVRLQQFDAARATAQRLSAAAPQIMPVLRGFIAAAAAEEHAARRLTDPTLAGKRSTVGLPSPVALAYVQLAVAHAQRDTAGAAAALAQARAMATPISGSLVLLNQSQKPFANLVDSDDLTGATLVCYEGERVLDLPYADIREVLFGEPKTSFDMMWMPAQVTLVDGTPLSVRIPTLYPGSALADDSFTRTGQSTSWDRELGYAIGKGQRDLSASNADGSSSLIGIQRIAAIRFNNAPRALVPGGGAGPRAGRAGGAVAPGAVAVGGPWTPPQIAVASVGAVAFLMPWLGLTRFLYGMPFPSIRAFFLLRGLVCCASFAWVAMQRAGRNAAIGAAIVTFVLTTLKWIM